MMIAFYYFQKFTDGLINLPIFALFRIFIMKIKGCLWHFSII